MDQRRKVGAAQQREIGHRGEVTAIELHADAAGVVEAPRQVPPEQRSSVSPMIAGANASAARSCDSPSRERQIATGPGQGSANTAPARQHDRLFAIQRWKMKEADFDRPDR